MTNENNPVVDEEQIKNDLIAATRQLETKVFAEDQAKETKAVLGKCYQKLKTIIEDLQKNKSQINSTNYKTLRDRWWSAVEKANRMKNTLTKPNVTLEEILDIEQSIRGLNGQIDSISQDVAEKILDPDLKV